MFLISTIICWNLYEILLPKKLSQESMNDKKGRKVRGSILAVMFV